MPPPRHRQPPQATLHPTAFTPPSALVHPSPLPHLIPSRRRLPSPSQTPRYPTAYPKMAPASAPLPAASLLSFMRLIGNLKQTKRTGWVYSSVPQPESVADHMYRMCMVAFSTSPDPSRTPHLIKLALVHDLAEAIVGDIAPADHVSKQEKNRREMEAMLHIRDDVLQGGEIGKEVWDLWNEYENGQTEDAKLIKEIDKLEMIVQADEYETRYGKDLGDFFESTRGAFHTPVIKDVDHLLRQQRDDRKKRDHDENTENKN